MKTALCRAGASVLAAAAMLVAGETVQAAAGTTAPAAKYAVAKTPAWVVTVADAAAAAKSAGDEGPTRILLSDTQVNLLGPKPVFYRHSKSIARERSGLESVSSINVPFNPHFETFTLHQLSLLRDGRRIDKLASARINVAQRESRLEEGVYDETAQAIIAVDDVRVGDVVEYAYSLAGDNPVFAGKYSQLFALAREVPISRLALRITYPAARKLFYRQSGTKLAIAESSRDGVAGLSLEADDLAAVRPEPSVPAWALTFPVLEVTEYESWQQLQQWATALYRTPNDLSPAIEQVLDRIRREAGTPRAMTEKTLAWVQNEIRYYSVAVGTSSHRPNHPNVTFQQRFGDCKDKSVLLAAMLRRLGIDAEPALVSAQFQKGIADWLPTPWAFDHVVVRVNLDGRSYWLDGTQTYQGSDLDHLGFTPFGKALPTETATGKLVDVMAPPQARSESQLTETFTVTYYGAPTDMAMEQKYFGNYAEWFRRRVAADSLKNYLDALQAEYGRDFPNITRSGEPVVIDDTVANAITLKQSFRIPKLFTYEKGRAKTSVYASSLVPAARFPRTPERKFPLALPYPGSYAQRIVLNLPQRLEVPSPPPERWQDRHVAMDNTIKARADGVTFDYGLRILDDSVAAADFAVFSDKMKQAFSMLFSSASLPLVDNARLTARINREFERAGANLRDPDQGESLRQNALRDFAVADEAVHSNLLAGPLLAQAYRDLAEAESLLGRRSDALRDIETSLGLEASDAGYVLKAEMQIYARRYGDALETLGRASQDAGRAATLTDFGIAHYYLGNYGEAQRSFARAADVATADELPHVLIWLAMAAKRAGYDANGIVDKYRSRLSDAWPAPGIALLLGETATDKVLATASGAGRESRARLCEAYFYLGQKALADGNLADAKRWFSKSVDTDIVVYREHALAQHELSRLGR